MWRKKTWLQFSFIVLFVCSLTASSVAAVLAEFHGATAKPDHITLTWADNPQTTQTITWRTDTATGSGKVQFAEMAETGDFPQAARTVDAETEVLRTGLGDMNIHFVTLTGLKPGTRYWYRVGGDAGWSEPRIFQTSGYAAPYFKFLVFGDAQSINYDVWRTTLHRAYRENADAAFLTNVGDLVDMGEDYSQWNAWFDASRGVIDIIPVMPVTGNHEYYTAVKRQYLMPVFFTAQFKLPANGPDGLKGQVYSFDYGDVHFIMLDSQVNEGAQFIPAMLEKQKAWLEEDLQRTDKKWKIAFFHRPPYSNQIARSNDNIRAAFVPILDKYHVDLVFTAHDHVYARTYPLHSDAIVDNYAKGTVYVATGRSGTKTYTNTVATEWNEIFYNPLDEPNYITVEVREDTLTLTAFKQSGAIIDALTIDKSI